jgi:hypothetical protein
MGCIPFPAHVLVKIVENLAASCRVGQKKQPQFARILCKITKIAAECLALAFASVL